MAGKRHSAGDAALIQTAHDSLSSLGANCSAMAGWTPYESARILEAALPINQSHDDRRGHVRTALRTAHSVTDSYSSDGPWITDMFDTHVVYQHQGKTFKRSYSVDHGSAGSTPKVTLGNPKPVHRAYMDSSSEASEANLWAAGESVINTGENIVQECGELGSYGDFVCEAAAAVGGLIPIKLIAPGWGSSGYYSADMLKRDGSKAFPKNTHMYINHATPAEEKARPEGDYKALAAVLTEDAAWNDKGFNGPGLYSMAKTFSDHDAMIREKGKYTGVSIRAFHTGLVEGEYEGRKGKAINGLAKGISVDFVTKAGAGGAPLVEGERRNPPIEEQGQENNMTEQEATALREAQESLKAANVLNAKLVQEAAQRTLETNRALAAGILVEAFKAKGLVVTLAAAQVMVSNPPLTSEGKVDEAAIKAMVEGVTLSNAPRKPTAKITNLGADAAASEATAEEAEAKAFTDTLTESFKAMGLTEVAAKVAAGGRV